MWGLENFEKFYSFEAGKARIKCLGLVDLKDNELLVSASSEGEVKVWHIPSLASKKYEKEVEKYVLSSSTYDQRILCLEAGLDDDVWDEDEQ